MVVDGDAGDGVDEDAELAGVRNLVGQARVQGVDSFDQEHRVGFEFQGLAVVLSDSCHEVVFRHLYGLSGEEPEYVLLKGDMIDGVEIVEIVVAVGQLRGVETVHEIVVGGEGNRVQAAGLELDAEPLAECGLPAACGARDEHEPYRRRGVEASVDFLGNLHYLLFLKCLGYLNQLACLALLAGDVHVTHAVQLHERIPVDAFREHVKCLRLLEERRELLRVVAVWHAQEHTAAVFLEFPDIKIARCRDKCVIEIVDAVSECVVVNIDRPRSVYQFGHVRPSICSECRPCLIGLHFLPVERKILCHDFAHSLADFCHIVPVESEPVGLYERAEISL